MVTHQKALIANTDLASAQVFIFQLSEYHLSLIISGKADNVFLSIKQTMLDLENQIKAFQGPVPSLFTYLTQALNKQIAYLSEYELLLIAWTTDVLYLQRSGASTEPQSLPQALLLRDDHLEPLPFSNQNQLVSGYIKPGDRVLLSNSGLITLLQTTTNSNEALTLLANSPPDSLQDVLSSLSIDQEHEPPVALLQLEVITPPPVIESPATDFEPSFGTPSDSLSRPASPTHRGELDRGWRTRRKTRSFPIIRLPRNYALLLIAIALFILIPAAIYRLFFNQTITPTSPPPPPTGGPTASALPANTYQVTDWPTLISLDLIKDKFAPTNFSYSDSKLLMLDVSQKSLISFDLTEKSPTVLGGQKQLQDPQFASTNGDFAFVYSPGKGVVRISLTTQKDTLAAPKSTEWGSIVDLSAFGSNFYLLDAGKSNIWKYLPTDTGYSNPQSYFKEGVVTAFSDARKLRIDSSVWILKGLDEILKYTSGSQDFYGLSEFPQNLKTITSFYVGADTENVYLLDSQSSAVFVTTKTGKFVALYLGDKFKDAVDIFADEKSKTLYLIDSQKIYQIPLH